MQQCLHRTVGRKSITFTIFGLSSNNREEIQPCPSTENRIKDLLSMAPPIRTRPSFPLSQSLSSGSFHKPLILLHQRAAAATAKSLQLCSTLCNPIDGSPPGSPVPGITPGKNTGVGCHFLLQCMKVKSESEVAQLCLTLSNPMDCSPPGSSVHEGRQTENHNHRKLTNLVTWTTALSNSIKL